MLVPRRYRDIFRYEGRTLFPGKHLVDQTQINYDFQRAGAVGFDLGPTFNYFVALSASRRQFEHRFEHQVLHYAGFESFYPNASLEARIREDLAIIYPETKAADPSRPFPPDSSRP
jgi:hypothetical protein